MKLYHTTTGIIVHAIYARDLFSQQVKAEFLEYDVDEIDPTNKALCYELSLYGNVDMVDINGDSKYYIDGDGDLAERDGWAIDIEDL